MGKGWLWSADESGCGWYRTVIVAEALRKLGHDVGQGVVFEDSYADADAVLGQRMCLPGASTVWARWNIEREKTTVFDADDDYFHMHQHPEFGEAAVEYSKHQVQARLIANAASSTYTTCASPRLADIFAQFCNNVVLIPNGLPEEYLDEPAPYDRFNEMGPTEQGLHRPVVGWAGSAFTQWELTAPVKEAVCSVADWGGKMHTVGVPYHEMKKHGLARPGISITGWVPSTPAYLSVIDFDIWVAPYRRTDYNEAKVATKALEAAFLGIPIVASDTTPYRQFVVDGETGFLVPPGGDWAKPIRELINNPDLRERMGRAAREVASGFTVEKLAAALWASVLFDKEKGL